MASRTLWPQKWQKNQIFEAIQGVGLDPKEFDLEDDDAEIRVKHKWSESCFIIGGDPGHYVGRHVVGDGVDWPFEVYSWQAIIPRISRWLEDVKRDLETPDLWAELRGEAELLGANSDDVIENTPFTADEQKEIAGRLQGLAEHARRTYSLSGAQMRVLDAKLDYLVNAAGRLGRKDWRNVFIGAITSLILSAVRGRPEKLALDRRPQPVAKTDPGCEVHRRDRGLRRFCRASSRRLILQAVTKIRR